MATAKKRLCANKACKKPIPENAKSNRRYCDACSKIAARSGKAFLERGRRINAAPQTIVYAQPDADVVTETECRVCKGPWNGSFNTGYFCVECREKRRFDIHASIDRTNAKLALERQAQDREYYRIWKEQQQQKGMTNA